MIKICENCLEAGDELNEKLEEANEKLRKINDWCNAYPLDIFKELTSEDFKKIGNILKKNGFYLDSISASNMRHVLKGIKSIIRGK